MSSARRSAGIVFLAALGIRLAGGWWLGHFAHPVAWEYETIADNLLHGNGFLIHYLEIPYRAFTLPLYPVLCAAVYALTNHSHTALLVLQCFISALACLQVRAIGMLIFEKPSIALAGAWLVAFHPGLIHFASRLHSLTLTVFLFLWVVQSWLNFIRIPTRPKAFLAGLSSGLALLTRGTFLLFFPVVMGGFLWKGRRQLKSWELIGVAGITMGIVVAPWLVRNALLFHRFPVFLTTGGHSFWQGNNPNSSGSSLLSDGRGGLSAMPEGMVRQLAQLDESGQNQLFYREACGFVRDHPFRAIGLFGKKFLSFWWFPRQVGQRYPAGFTRWYQRYYALVGALALAGLWGCRRGGLTGPLLILLLFPLCVSVHQSLYYVDGRHRWTVEPLLLLLAAKGALDLNGKMTGRARSSAVRAGHS